MPLVSYLKREITFKIVYYGPGFAGKTTNMQCAYQRTAPADRGELSRIMMAGECEVSFDLRIRSELMRGFNFRLKLCTIPGPIFNDPKRRLILRGVDGVIFVADSQEARSWANVEMLEELETNLVLNGDSLAEVPMVLQYNKRDLPEIMSVAQLDEMLNPAGRVRSEGIATQGIGVFETVDEIGKQVIEKMARATS